MAIWSAEIKELEKLHESFGGQLSDLEKSRHSLSDQMILSHIPLFKLMRGSYYYWLVTFNGKSIKRLC
jgi:hypothetical protein